MDSCDYEVQFKVYIQKKESSELLKNLHVFRFKQEYQKSIYSEFGALNRIIKTVDSIMKFDGELYKKICPSSHACRLEQENAITMTWIGKNKGPYLYLGFSKKLFKY